MIGNLAKKTLITLKTLPLAKDILPKLPSKVTSFVLNSFERKVSGQEAVRTEKGFNLFISNKDMDGFMRIVKLLDDSGLFIDVATGTVKHEIKKRRWIFWCYDSLIAPMASSLIQPASSSIINAISDKRVMSAGKGQEG